MSEQIEMAGLDEQLDLFTVGPSKRKPAFDSEVWERAELLHSERGTSASMMLAIRMCDDLLSDDDRQFFIDVRRAIKWLGRKRGPIVY